MSDSTAIVRLGPLCVCVLCVLVFMRGNKGLVRV
jgi:hypothetical protein